MKQRYHTIIKPAAHGQFVGWVEEMPGAITYARTLDECRMKLKDSLLLLVETHRDEARRSIDPSCILEAIEIDVVDQQEVYFA
jgi:predicted RNase H-like HicB family nuclease